MIIGILLLATTACSSKETSDGEDYPTKDVEFIVAFSAGGTSDLNARLIEQYFEEEIGARAVVVYKPGAGGEIGFTDIANADPDGYTIGGLNTPHVVLQPLGRETEFTPESFEYLAQLVSDPIILAVKPDSKFNSLEDFIKEAKAKPNSITVGIVGTLTGGHLALLKMMDELSIEVTNVPFPGSSDNTAALLGGHVDAIIGNVGDVAQDPDMYKLLGIMTEERHEWLPDTPTFKENGYDVFATIRRGIAAPAGLPEKVYEKLEAGIARIVAKEGYLEDMTKIGLPEHYLTGEEFKQSVMEEKVDAERLLKKFGLIE